jgi:cytochrome b561
LALGLYMTRILPSDTRIALYVLHKEIGIVILVLALFRLLWRLSNIVPPLTALPWQERILARLVHGSLYVLFFAMPITGWMLSSAAGKGISFFGLFTIPRLIAPSESLKLFFVEAHTYLAYIFIAILFLHIIGTLKHYFIDKNTIMRRML